MKKILAIMLAVILALSISVPAFAAKSPGGNVYFVVIINKPDTSEGAADGTTKDEKVTVKENGTIVIKPVEDVEIKFEGWGFFKQNGSAAKEGVDYKIESVKLADGTEAKKGVDYEVKEGNVVAINNTHLEVTFIPLADGLHVSADEEYVPKADDDNKEPVSPPTADFSMAVAGLLFALVVLSGASVVAAAKRVR